MTLFSGSDDGVSARPSAWTELCWLERQLQPPTRWSETKSAPANRAEPGTSERRCPRRGILMWLPPRMSGDVGNCSPAGSVGDGQQITERRR
jgi:hypothetical protein